ncbi:MAG: FHA domain-containing protein, partial [Clostridiales bacterium]|nr:FHA domain-containing protein [Clostridiales bacterium]
EESRRVTGKKERIRHGRWGAAALLFVIAVFLGSLMVRAAGDAYKIEQLSVEKPVVTVYYRTADPGGEIAAYLDGEELSLTSNELFSDIGEGVEYYVMLDVSASIPTSRFSDIRESLAQFTSELRDVDSLILVTFGEEIQTLLDGTEEREEAQTVIAQLQNPDQDTLLFEAIDTVSDMITEAASKSQKRRVMVILSDGKDCADDTRSVETVESTLVSSGIPVYTLAFENNEGDSQAEMTSYRGKFSSLAVNTGGIAWVVSDEENTLDGLTQMRMAVLDSYRACFSASSNRVSNKNEDFVLKFVSAGNVTDTHSVLVERGQADTEAPQITRITMGDLNEIRVSYSEKVVNASDVSNYSVKKDGQSIPVQQVQTASDEENCYILVFGSDLYSGQYSVSVSNVTDDSNEENALSEPSLTIELNGLEETETEPETEEQTDVKEVILKWWPVVLTVIFLILILVILLVYRGIKKRKGVLFVDGHMITQDKVEEKVHVAVESTPDLPRKQITLWLSNGGGEPKRIDKVIESSLIIGRSVQCDIYCDDPMMSRQHFALETDGDALYITDLQTRNGTSVNGVAIGERYRLARQDEIMAGNIRFRITWN